MKKVLSFALVAMLVLSAASFAQTKKAAAAPNMKMAVGIDNGLASLKFDNPDFSAAVGLLFADSAGTSVTSIGGKYLYKLNKGTVTTNLGGSVRYSTMTNWSEMILRAVYGAETTIAGALNVGFDVYPISVASTTSFGTTSTAFGLGGGQVYAYLNF